MASKEKKKKNIGPLFLLVFFLEYPGIPPAPRLRHTLLPKASLEAAVFSLLGTQLDDLLPGCIGLGKALTRPQKCLGFAKKKKHVPQVMELNSFQRASKRKAVQPSDVSLR